MIKTWHKWFVCIFAAVFVSIFFMYDAIFINASSGSSVVTPPIIIADDDIDDDKPDTPTPKPDDDAKEDDTKEEVTIPTYTNAFVCLNDALARFNSAQNYTASFASSANSFGVVQNIKVIAKKQIMIFIWKHLHSVIHLLDKLGMKELHRLMAIKILSILKQKMLIVRLNII